jgi:hypothetical protein
MSTPVHALLTMTCSRWIRHIHKLVPHIAVGQTSMEKRLVHRPSHGSGESDDWDQPGPKQFLRPFRIPLVWWLGLCLTTSN